MPAVFLDGELWYVVVLVISVLPKCSKPPSLLPGPQTVTAYKNAGPRKNARMDKKLGWPIINAFFLLYKKSHNIICSDSLQRSGRGNFKQLVPVFTSTPVDFPWQILRFVAFDSPTPAFIANQTPYEERITYVMKFLLPYHLFVVLCVRIQSIDRAHIQIHANSALFGLFFFSETGYLCGPKKPHLPKRINLHK